MEGENIFKVGEWIIEAQMSEEEMALLQVHKVDGTAAFISSGNLELAGKRYGLEVNSSKLAESDGKKVIFKETLDQLPESISNVIAIMKNKNINIKY